MTPRRTNSRYALQYTRKLLGVYLDGGFPEVAPDYFPDDQVPDTLVAFLRYLFADHGPEMIGMLASYNA